MLERTGKLIQEKFHEYLLPTLLTTISLAMSSVVNSIVVGNILGEAALSAMSLSSPIVYLINAVFGLFVVGGMTCALIAKGRRDADTANGYFTLTFVFGLGVSILMVVAVLAFLRPIAAALSNHNEMLTVQVARFLAPLSLVGPSSLLVLGMATFARADGYPKTSAYIAIIANVVSVAATFVFLRYFGMGVEGAAWSMVLGYVVGLFTLIPYWRSKTRGFHLRRPGAGVFGLLANIARVGLPKSLTQCYSLIRTLVLNSLIMAIFGPVGVAALAVCLNAQMVTSMFIIGTSDTLLPIIGSLYGEKDAPGIRYAMRSGVRTLLIACFAALVVFECIPETIGRIFGLTSTEGLHLLRMALRLYALSLPLFGLNSLLQNFYQTTGRVRLAALIATLEGFLFVATFAFVLSRLHGDWIWLAFLFGELATLAVVYTVGKRAAAREKVMFPFLLDAAENPAFRLDATVPATAEASADLAHRIAEFCRGHGVRELVGNRVAVAVEEMAANVAIHAMDNRRRGGPPHLDVLVRVDDEEIITRIRDDGPPFDPVSYRSDEEGRYVTDGIELAKRLANRVAYSRQLGFNNTVLAVVRGAANGDDTSFSGDL